MCGGSYFRIYKTLMKMYTVYNVYCVVYTKFRYNYTPLLWTILIQFSVGTVIQLVLSGIPCYFKVVCFRRSIHLTYILVYITLCPMPRVIWMEYITISNTSLAKTWRSVIPWIMNIPYLKINRIFITLYGIIT